MSGGDEGCARNTPGPQHWTLPPLQAGHTDPTSSASGVASMASASAAGLDPAAAVFAPRDGSSEVHTASGAQSGMAGSSAERLNPAAVDFVPRGGVSSVGGPMCPDDHWYCSDGTRAARQVRSNADRYTYQCNVCLRHFDQRRPNLVRQDESRDPRWRQHPRREPHLKRAQEVASNRTTHHDVAARADHSILARTAPNQPPATVVNEAMFRGLFEHTFCT